MIKSHELRMRERIRGGGGGGGATVPASHGAGGGGDGGGGESRIEIQQLVQQELGAERTMVTVRVPATSANMGPGFDTLGMAIDMWSEMRVEKADKFSIEVVLPSSRRRVVLRSSG